MNIILAFVAGTRSSLIVFVAICVAVLAALIGAVGYTSPSRANSTKVMLRWIIGIAFYCMLIAWIVYDGLLERAFIPFGPLFLVCTVTIAIAIGFTRVGSRMANGVPIAWLVFFAICLHRTDLRRRSSLGACPVNKATIV